MADGRRLRLLCEDRRTERFVHRLCQHRGVRLVDTEIAPAGRGDAAAWVRRKYAAFVRTRRSKNFQQNLVALVVVDGDRQGVAARKRELDAEMGAVGLARRSPDEPIALFVPTWSIAWNGTIPPLPSLADAYLEAGRVGLQ